MKKCFSLMIALMALAAVITPVLVGAQESEPGSSIEVVRGGSDQKDAGEASFVGFGLLILIGIGLPTAASLGLRHIFKSNLKTYIATYVFVVLCYVLANMTIEGTPSGSLAMTGLMLLLLAMLGSVIAQTIFLLRLPKRTINK